MQKQELIDAVAAKTGLAKNAVKEVVDGLFSVATKELADGGSLTIVGFGTFAVKDRPARIGRNPQTGASMEIAASKAVAFKPGKTLKDAVAA